VQDEITVLTPTLPDRKDLLEQARESVAVQLHAAADHVVITDDVQAGPAKTRNAGLEHVSTPWTAFLDDDDLMDRGHLKLLIAEAERSEATVVWSWCRRIDGGPEIPRAAFFDPIELRQDNFIPITVLAQTDAVRAVGGFDPTAEHEDHDLWLRMLDNGARFSVVRAVTWSYRGRENE